MDMTIAQIFYRSIINRWITLRAKDVDTSIGKFKIIP